MSNGCTSGAFEPERELPTIERSLDVAGRTLDSYPGGSGFGVIAVGFGRRARSLWHGTRYALAGPSHTLVQVGLRAMVEILLLESWLALNPDLHPRIWTAESERHILKLGHLAPSWAGARMAAGIAGKLPAERTREIEARVAAVRAEALEAQVRGVGSKGSLIPSLEVMAAVVDTPMVREAYAIVYAMLSSFAHSGAGVLGIRVTREGVAYDDDRPESTLGDRTMAAITFASILELTSDVAGLGVSDAARTMRARMLVWSEPPTDGD